MGSCLQPLLTGDPIACPSSPSGADWGEEETSNHLHFPLFLLPPGLFI